MVEQLDITSEGLRNQGYSLMKEGATMALYHNGSCHRIGFYKNDWDKSIKKIEEKLGDAGIEQLIIQGVISSMSANYPKLMNGHDGVSNSTSTTTSKQNHTRLQMAPKATRANCSIDEWRIQLKTKHDNLKNTTEIKAPGLWLPLEFVISVKCILNIRDITLPVIGIILGPAGSWKSQAVNMPKGARDTFGLDSFSPKSFVSHNSNLNEEQLQEIDLLPKIKNKLFMVPELSPLFTSREEDLEQIIGMIVRIGDGEGYFSASGSKGARGYEGDIMFCWVGASVSIPYRIHKQLSKLGPKMYFLRLPMTSEDEDSLLNMLKENDFRERMRDIKTALFDYFEYLESCPIMQIHPESGIPKIEMDTKSPEQEQVQRYIIYLGELLAHLRGTVETWETEDTQGLDYAYGSVNIENVRRATTQLYNLARAHALSQGREHITIDGDLPIIVRVVLSGAASIERVKVLDLLLSGNTQQRYTASQVAEAIGTSEKTAKRTMVEFKALKLVEFEELGNIGSPLVSIRLKEGFNWFFSDEFKKLKGDYMTGDFKGDLVRKNKKQDEEGEGGQETII
jgi:hypothetical protein